jgi:hypothetical protein
MGTGDFSDDRTKLYHKMQFHHPAYLTLVQNGAELLAGIGQTEAFLLDTKKLIAGEECEPEILFRFDPETELSSFAAALDESRYVFFREDVRLPETIRQSATKLSDPAEQRTAGSLELYDRPSGEFVASSAISLQNPFSKRLRRRFQVFTLVDSHANDSRVSGIQIGCLLDDTPPKRVEVPYRRFVATWDDKGVGSVIYGDPIVINAQPHLISPGLRFYVSTNDEGYHRGLASPRLGKLRPHDTPTKTNRHDAVARHW